MKVFLEEKHSPVVKKKGICGIIKVMDFCSIDADSRRVMKAYTRLALLLGR